MIKMKFGTMMCSRGHIIKKKERKENECGILGSYL